MDETIRSRPGTSLKAWAALVTCFVILRVILWVLDPWPLLYGDSGTYIQAALNPSPYVIHPKGVSLLWQLAGVSVSRIAIAHILLTVLLGWSAWLMTKRFWIVAIVVLNPLVLIYERVLLAEHLFATAMALGTALVLRKNPLAGALFAVAAVTRTVGVLLIVPLAIGLLPSWRRLLGAVGLFAAILVLYVNFYVYPSTGAFTLSFLGPNAITVVAPIVDCPPAPLDICAWQHEHPNKIVFDANGPVQTRVRPKGWKAADAELRPVVFQAIARHPLKYAAGYLSRVPHLFNLDFHFDHGGADSHYGHSRLMLDRIQGPADRPGRNESPTMAWRIATNVFTIVAGILVLWVLIFSLPPLSVWLTIVTILFGSILFNDATGRFLYPAVALVMPFVRSPRAVWKTWRAWGSRIRSKVELGGNVPTATARGGAGLIGSEAGFYERASRAAGDPPRPRINHEHDRESELPAP